MYDDFDSSLWKLFTSTGQIGYYMFLSDLRKYQEQSEWKDRKE